MATAQTTGTDNDLLQVLLAEYDRMVAHIRELIYKGEKHSGLWIGITLLAFSVGFAEDITAVFFIVPITHIVLLYYFLSVHEHIFMSAGYAATLEDEINTIIKKQALRWESRIAPKHGHYRYSHVFVSGLAGVCTLAIWVAPFFVMDGKSQFLFGIELVVLFFVACPAFLWYCKLAPLYRVIHEDSLSMYNEPFKPSEHTMKRASDTLEVEKMGE